MSSIQIRPATSNDVDSVQALLRDCDLPIDGWREHVDSTLVAVDGARVIGSAALERYGDAALLRSVAIDRDRQRRGLGGELTTAAIRLAATSGTRELFLLTTTAETFFSRIGFVAVERAEVPDAVKQSVEFRSACPESARVMRLTIRP
jgi:amino-acid N-acetyltransferase